MKPLTDTQRQLLARAFPDLASFTGTERWFRHPLNRKLLYTEGVQYVAEQAGAYWLLDEIALAHAYEPAVAAEEFQFWSLTVTGSTAELVCEDGNERAVFSKHIAFTDFPAPGIRFYLTGGVLLLPSEY
jgi:hypothetical protein